jgi:hypothetical protein
MAIDLYGVDVHQNSRDAAAAEMAAAAVSRPSTSVLESSSGSIKVTLALSSSRSVCKLPHVVGCAPVTYGLPMNFKQKKELE